MARYVVLLRGINVGGNNLIKMSALKACLEKAGYADVSTFIASGNVFVSTDEKGPALVTKIEKILATSFAYDANVVIRSKAQMKAIVAKAPPGFGDEPDRYRYNVLFLKEPLTAAAAMKSVKAREGVDTAAPGPGVIYFSNLMAKATQSQLNKIVGSPIYKSLTIRNWNTTSKLAQLMAEA